MSMRTEICMNVTALFYPEHLPPPKGIPVAPEAIEAKFDEIVQEHFPRISEGDYGFKKETWVGSDDFRLFICSEEMLADEIFGAAVRVAEHFYPGINDDDTYFQSEDCGMREVIDVQRNICGLLL